MNARTVAFIASRLLALYLFVMYVLNFTAQGVAIFVSRQIEPDQRSWAYFGMSFTPIVSALLAAVLWFGAGWISSRVVKSLPQANAEAVDIDQWKTLVVAAIGALFVLRGAGVFSQSLRMLLRDNTLSPFIIGSSVCYVLAGIALIAWSRSVISGVKAVWSWFAKPAFTGEEP